MKPENLIDIDKSILKPGQRFIKIADGVFLPVGVGGSIPGGGTGIEPRLGVAVDDGQGNIKFQPLSFTGTTPADSGASEDFTGYSYNTGKDEPVFPGGGGGGGGVSAEYYKCTSVDTTTHTWSGNKAVLTEGIYTFSPDVTSGLTYTEVIPSVGKIYSSDTLIKVASLYQGGVVTEGLIFNAPCDSLATTTPTGQTLTIPASAQVAELDGITAINFNDSETRIESTLEKLDSLSSVPNTLAMWIMPRRLNSNAFNPFILLKADPSSYTNPRELAHNPDRYLKLATSINHEKAYSTSNLALNQWNHIVGVYTGTELICYINGKEEGRITVSGQTGTGYLGFGYCYGGGNTGAIADVRIYNRAITPDEVAQLYHVFK